MSPQVEYQPHLSVVILIFWRDVLFPFQNEKYKSGVLVLLYTTLSVSMGAFPHEATTFFAFAEERTKHHKDDSSRARTR